MLSYALIRDHQPDPAVAHLSGALVKHPDNALLYCLMGQAHALAGRADQARRFYAAAGQVDPDSTLAAELMRGTQIGD